MHKYYYIALSLLIIFISAFLRLWDLNNNPGWYCDECIYVNICWNFIHSDFRYGPFIYSFFPRMPLWMLLNGTIFIFLGKSLLTIRIISAISGVLITYLCLNISFTLTKNRYVSILAGLIYGTFHYAVLFNRWGFPFSFYSLINTLTFLFILKYLICSNNKYLLYSVIFASLSSITELFGIPNILFLLIMIFKPNKAHRLQLISILLLPLAIYFAFNLLFLKEIFIEDISIRIGKDMLELSNPNYIYQLFALFRILVTEFGWITIGIIGFAFIKDKRIKVVSVSYIFLSIFVLFALSLKDTTLLYRTLIILLPFFVCGLSVLIISIFNLLMMIIDRHMPIIKEFLKGILSSFPFSYKKYANVIYLFVIPLLISPSLNHTLNSVLKGFSTPLDLYCINDTDDAMNLASLINGNTTHNDIVLTTHLDWLLECRTGILMQAAACEGYEDISFYPIDIVSDRFSYDCSLDNVKFVVLHSFTYNFEVIMPGISELLRRLNNWPIYSKHGHLITLVNPKYINED